MPVERKRVGLPLSANSGGVSNAGQRQGQRLRVTVIANNKMLLGTVLVPEDDGVPIVWYGTKSVSFWQRDPARH